MNGSDNDKNYENKIKEIDYIPKSKLQPNAVVQVYALVVPVDKGFVDKNGYPLYSDHFEIYIESPDLGVWFMTRIVEKKKENV